MREHRAARRRGLRVRESSELVCCSRDRVARDEELGWRDNPAHCFLQYLLCDIIFSTSQYESLVFGLKVGSLWYGFRVSAFFSSSPFSIIRSGK